LANGKGIAAAAGIATATVLGAKEAAIGLHDLAGVSKLVRESSTISTEMPRAGDFHEVFPSYSNGPTLPPETEIPLRVAHFDAFATYNQNFHSSHKLTELIRSAQSKIDTDLSPYNTDVSIKQADEIIKSDLVTAISDAKDKPNSGITFEVLSGKLKVDSKFSMGGVNISGGEINVYKVSGAAAIGVAACRGLGASEFQACVNSALAKAVRTEISGEKAATER
jgi:hypothetical protein